MNECRWTQINVKEYEYKYKLYEIGRTIIVTNVVGNRNWCAG